MSLLARRSAGVALRGAEAQSRAGRHDAADKLLLAARRADPSLPHLALQTALAHGRAGRVDEALRELAAAPEPARASLPYRLFEGFFLARRGRLDQARSVLEPLLASAPANRVVATALAYAQLRAGAREAAVELLRDPGDNLELLSWAWLELERAWLKQPARPDAPVPPLPFAPAVDAGAARRFFKAGVAAAYGYEQVVWRRRLRGWSLARPLHGLLDVLERRWPTDPLTAFRLAEAAGLGGWELGLHLGLYLAERGCQRAALDTLDRAIAAAEAALATTLEAVKPEDREQHRADWQATEEVCLLHLGRAAALVELRRWDDAEAELAIVIAAESQDSDDAGRTHEFAQPELFVRRALVRLARDRADAARADLERALDGDPSLFAHRLTALLRA